jgi:biopolymer transport protein ExbD
LQAPGGKTSVIADINITPLLDLAWVLLVIFILTTTALVQGIDVKLPETADHKQEVPTEVATVSVDKTGQVFLNDAPIQLPELEEKLRIFKLANPNLPVILRADRSIVYDQVVQVLDVIKKVPVDNLALATQVE